MHNDVPNASQSGAQILRKSGRVEANPWHLSLDGDALPNQRPAIVPLALWQASPRSDRLAPLLDSDVELSQELARELRAAPLVAIRFPVFTDGRGYTLARLLRERYALDGEIRAVGDVLIDQLFYMARCGFDAFDLRDDQLIENAIKALDTFSLSYQSVVDIPEPLFTRRLRESAAKRREVDSVPSC
ncbi:Uncharacterized conserved protein, DUF934 family [Modicisalibacter muralis]|uniref:Uncharacterized conserved protein, DUF934 family n=1 Tax=Modicisalibacter muralis TaxID=119000 RepID=A0A1G9GHG8_9GAMM|nr:DUF934 domain-containing protein [Halomonas muralis]SDL00042.1 Uncharacterized conserved protein, DUF934 family [Halomonas muralis]